MEQDFLGGRPSIQVVIVEFGWVYEISHEVIVDLGVLCTVMRLGWEAINVNFLSVGGCAPKQPVANHKCSSVDLL